MSETNDAPITSADDQAAQLSTRRSADGEAAMRNILDWLDWKRRTAARGMRETDEQGKMFEYGTMIAFEEAVAYVRGLLDIPIAAGASRVGTREDDIR